MGTGLFSGVGLGPGNPELLTLAAVRALREADFVFTVASRNTLRSVSDRIINSIEGLKAERKELRFSMAKPGTERSETVHDNAVLIAEELRRGKNCVFATIGDPMTYSTCGYILEELKTMTDDLKFRIIPGVNSWSALAAEAGVILVEDTEELRIIPSYEKPGGESLDKILSENNTAVFLKTYRSKNAIIRHLKSHGAAFIYGSNIGLDPQFISRSPDEASARKEEYLSMIILKPKHAGR